MDMQAIGRKISSLRKERDMTQVDLADKLGVTYQAISSWERGNSMPDIAKLPDLSRVLEVSIDDLLNNKKATELVKKVLSGDDPSKTTPDMETLADIAPILKPSQVTELINQAKNTQGEEKLTINREMLELLTQYMESGDLKEVLLNNNNITVDMIAEVVDYMESGDLKEILLHGNNITVDMLAEVVDYMESGDLKEILLHNNNITVDMIAEVVDYMESGDLKDVLLHNSNITVDMIIEVVDYMESSDLKEILLHHKNIDKKTLKEIASHMDEDDLIDLIVSEK